MSFWKIIARRLPSVYETVFVSFQHINMRTVYTSIITQIPTENNLDTVPTSICSVRKIRYSGYRCPDNNWSRAVKIDLAYRFRGGPDVAKAYCGTRFLWNTVNCSPYNRQVRTINCTSAREIDSEKTIGISLDNSAVTYS